MPGLLAITDDFFAPEESEVTQIHLSEHQFQSPTLGNSRQVRFQEPQGAAPSCVCIFLDAEYYVELLGAPEITHELQASGEIPSLLAAYVSHVDHEVRWPESFCNRDFDRCVVDELIPWIMGSFDLSPTIEVVIVGVSLTGLSAAHAALASEDRISRALCQSASFWWEQGWFRKNLASHPPSQVRFRLSVGVEETKEWVDHGNGLVQEESQLESNRETRDALRARGHHVSYHEFSGGHDLDSFRADLPGSLVALFEM